MKFFYVIKLYLALLLFAFCLIGKTYPQVSDISFDHIFLEQGLSQSIINCMMQDKTGFMYFGTEDGMNIYDGYTFTIFRKNPSNINSLSYNDINSLAQDNYGRVWIGTFNAGINLYIPEKKLFKHFFHDHSANALSNDNINVVKIDKKGIVWVGTDEGLNRIAFNQNDSDFIITNGVKSKNQLYLNNFRILSLMIAKDENIWVGTDNGLYKITLDKKDLALITEYKNIPSDKNSISSNLIRTIFEDSKGNLWIGTNKGLNKINSSNRNNDNPIFIHFLHNPNDNHSISHNDITTVAEDASGYIWVGTNGGGLNIYDEKKNKFEVYQNDPLDARSLSVNEIRVLFLDKSGIMWIGTYGGGLNKVSRGRGQFFHYKSRRNAPNSLSHKVIWCFYQDKDSILWIGTHRGLDKLDRKTNTYKHYLNIPGRNSLSNNMVRVITKLKDGKFLIGTNGGGIDEFDPVTEKFKNYSHNPNDSSSIIRNEIRCIYVDKSDNIWVGSYGSGLDKFDRSKGNFIHYYNIPEDTTSISHDYIRTIVEDKYGNLWIGTEGGGLNKFDKRTGKFTRYLSKTSALLSAYIFSISIDSSGVLWIGTFDSGLNIFDPVKNTCKVYGVDKGLPSNSIYSIVKDDYGYYWLSTNNGLSRFKPSEMKFKNFNVKDGLQDNEFNGGSYLKTLSGELLFGGINGFSAFYPDKIKDNKFIPPVVLTSFKKFNVEADLPQPISSTREIELAYNEDIFSLEFAALDYSSPEKNLYAYKMEGVDKDWVYVGANKRFVSYTTLPPGKYTFYVKGSNSDGLWNEKGIILNIKVIPPIWERWWFILILGLLFLGIFLLLYLRRLRIIRMKVELHTAHEAQLSIMPNVDPVQPGMEISGTCIPANEVGGDFFDYFHLNNDENKFGIMIGDVSGKAMKAAITAIMTSGMIISEVKSKDCINEVLENVNESLIKKIGKGMFVSICLCVIDVKSMVLTICNAGLNRPILVSDNNYEPLISDGPRLPLGLKNNVGYMQSEYSIKNGDVIIFTTDGVNEAQNNSRQLFGDEKLKTHIMSLNKKELSASEIKFSVINEVQRFIKREKPSDDMTVIAVKIK
ncbi:MAG TPA: two-component regulator propeller domain-containing protein [Ignavibacteriaceae bacterium]|nr:two-component regulator propeller domain-containing protein [Ignavibacteriaceae bacterium]